MKDELFTLEKVKINNIVTINEKYQILKSMDKTVNISERFKKKKKI